MANHWQEGLAAGFVDGAYGSVKGVVRTAVLHGQLLAHLAEGPRTVLDIGAGAGHQSLPLARAGHRVTLLEPSPTMRDRAAERIAGEPAPVRDRVSVVAGVGEDVAALTGGATFDLVLCHGVLMYLEDPGPLLRAACGAVAPGGLVSLLALNARTLAVRPAQERRWDDALRAITGPVTHETGVLGTDTRADTVEDLSARLADEGVDPVARYGVWLWSDWMDLGPLDPATIEGIVAAEAAAARTEPYRSLSRVFHLVGRRRAGPSG